MPTKDSILENVSQYNAEQLVRYIRAGIVTFDELCNDTDGEFAAATRHQVKHLLDNGDPEEWSKVQSENTIEAAQRYLTMYPDGKFRAEARKLKTALEEKAKAVASQATAELLWASVDKSDIEALKDFVAKYPDNVHVSDANKLINDLLLEDIMAVDIDTLFKDIRKKEGDINATRQQIDNYIIDKITEAIQRQKITKNDFLEKFSEDYNLLSAGVVKRLIDNGVFNISDIVSIGIDRDFIRKMLEGASTHDYTATSKLDKIDKQSTEIYFWGIPSSGKSCALGAILSVASNGKVAKVMDMDTQSQGYGYMNYLINHFPQNEIGTLIGRTPKEAFYGMGFDLIEQDGKIHPITCIDMAGELMRSMYKSNDRSVKLEQKDIEMLDAMHKILVDNRSINRKMHFFVIEYGAEDRLYEGMPQSTYLNGAVSYIKDTGIFKRDTDAIYIMITKADKIKNLTKEAITQYIHDKYHGFYNGLEQICKDNEINGKKVEKVLFSLGDVCFQDFCKFNSKPAENIVRIILERTASYRRGKRGVLEKILKG